MPSLGVSSLQKYLTPSFPNHLLFPNPAPHAAAGCGAAGITESSNTSRSLFFFSFAITSFRRPLHDAIPVLESRKMTPKKDVQTRSKTLKTKK
jgi:hypothetical protein